MKKLLIVDGNSIMNRAFYGVRALQTKDGLFTNAVYGTATIIKRNLEAVNPDYFAVAFDVHAPTFRHNSYDKYKSNRHGMPDELRVQVPYIKECLGDMGARCIELEGYEADDILGTFAELASKEDIHTYIVTGDRDSLQLISDKTTVLLATNAEPIEYTPKAFEEKYGVRPDQFVDVKALMGDSSDCIPGVMGIGEKTAFKLIAENGSLDGLYGKIDEIKLSPSVHDKLVNGKDDAYMSQYLATICRNAPVKETIGDTEYHGFDRPKLRELFTKLEFSALIRKFGLDTEEEPEAVHVEAGAAESTLGGLDSACVSVLLGEDGTWYLSDGSKFAKTQNKDELEAFVKKAGHLVVYDKKTILHDVGEGHGFDEADDVMLMGYVISASEGGYQLKKLLSREFLVETDDPGTSVSYIGKLYDAYLSRMNVNELKLYRDIELPLCTVLYDMEKNGFKVNTVGLNEFSERLGDMQSEYEERIFMQTGERFNINSPKQLGVVLFEKMGLPYGKKKKTGAYSTNAEILNDLRPFSSVVDDILDYRQVGKLKSTYADGLVKAADPHGRIHTCFKQALTATGRLSSTEPNLQNIPIRTELGSEFRKYFVPEDREHILIDADYSQIELRLLAAISGDEDLIDAFRSGYDIHTATAMKVFHVPADGVTVALRKKAKAINFGIVYGIGEFTLSNDLGVSIKEASNYIKSYFDTYPGVKQYLDGIVAQAHEKKYVETLFGRKRIIPELMSAKKMEIAFGERVAMNSPIQGTAADIIKLAMVNTYRKLKEQGYDARLILQVHDELIIETNVSCADAVESLLKNEMENAVSLSVPLTVSIAKGDTWYDAK